MVEFLLASENRGWGRALLLFTFLLTATVEARGRTEADDDGESEALSLFLVAMAAPDESILVVAVAVAALSLSRDGESESCSRGFTRYVSLVTLHLWVIHHYVHNDVPTRIPDDSKFMDGHATCRSAL